MGQANTLTDPNDTLWNMLTSAPITTESTSTSEVNKIVYYVLRFCSDCVRFFISGVKVFCPKCCWLFTVLPFLLTPRTLELPGGR